MITPALEKLDTARPASSGSLLARILSSLVLIPIVLAAVHFGGRMFAAIVAFAAIVMLFEWTRMVERREFSPGFYVLSAAAAAAFYLAASGAFAAAYGVCGAGGLAAFFLGRRGTGIGIWSALAAPYIIAPSIALLWLRLDVENGRSLTYFIYAVVWAADTGAFVLGKLIGGPKISHALSPSKTWSGICGGVLAGGAVGAATLAIAPLGWSLPVGIVAAGFLGGASVVGDLVESAFKRNFGVKDISGFIPGHGGALDRMDGMIFATSAMTTALYLYMLIQKP